MTLPRVRMQVESILESNGLSWSTTVEGLVLRFSSAVVVLSFRTWGTQSLIELRSNVLRSVEAETVRVLATLNELNCKEVFGRWVFYVDEAVVSLEYDMLGDHLQEPELMAAFTSIAQLADHYDDKLQAEFGGRRGVD